MKLFFNSECDYISYKMMVQCFLSLNLGVKHLFTYFLSLTMMILVMGKTPFVVRSHGYKNTTQTFTV